MCWTSGSPDACFPSKGTRCILCLAPDDQQINDLTDFVDMLNAMRFGQLNSRTIEEFNKLSRPLVYNDGIEPTEM